MIKMGEAMVFKSIFLFAVNTSIEQGEYRILSSIVKMVLLRSTKLAADHIRGSEANVAQIAPERKQRRRARWRGSDEGSATGKKLYHLVLTP